MKRCTRCKREKTLTEFPKKKSQKDGYSGSCKPCKKEDDRVYYLRNSKKIRDRAKKYYEENKEYCAKRQMEYAKRNKEKIYKYNKQWSIENKDRINKSRNKWKKNNPEKVKIDRKISCAKRRASKLKRTPKWADLKKIAKFYKNCPEGYQVDHVIPLRGKEVSGLHILSNLQYLTVSENRSKGNRI